MRAQRRLKLRSRTGCSRCRTRHQKCDEQKPSCTRCRLSASVCMYESHRKSSPTWQNFSQLQLSPPRTISSGYRGCLSLTDASHARFLDYFLGDASSAICCHEAIQQDTCRAVVSVGSVFPSLLYSGLLFGALHKASKMRSSIDRKALDIQILELRATALSLLQNQLYDDGLSISAAVIATTLMLATCELHFDPDASSWRNHFECASFLLADAERKGLDKTGDTVLWRFIQRLFITQKFLVSLPSPSQSASSPSTSVDHPQKLPSVDCIGVIDSSLACCQDLLGVFRWIKALEDIQKCPQNTIAPEFEQLSADYVETMASELVRVVHRMIARDKARPAILSDDLAGLCDEEQLNSFRMASTVAHHIALIYLNRYGLNLNPGAAAIRASVGSIVQLAGAMPKRDGLHPSIVLTTALFVAGCEAQDEAQNDIRSLLQVQYEITRNQGAHRTLQTLDRLWASTSHNSGFISGFSPKAIVGDDFVPY